MTIQSFIRENIDNYQFQTSDQSQMKNLKNLYSMVKIALVFRNNTYKKYSLLDLLKTIKISSTQNEISIIVEFRTPTYCSFFCRQSFFLRHT